MAHPSPQEPAGVPASRSRPGGAATVATKLAAIVWLPLRFFGFLIFHLLSFHAPAPRGVKVAMAGSVSPRMFQGSATIAEYVMRIRNREMLRLNRNGADDSGACLPPGLIVLIKWLVPILFESYRGTETGGICRISSQDWLRDV